MTINFNDQLLVHLTGEDLKGLISEEIGRCFSEQIQAQRLKIEAAAKMITASEARAMARCGNGRIYAALKSGSLPSVAGGNTGKGERRLISVEDVMSWISQGMPTAVAGGTLGDGK